MTPYLGYILLLLTFSVGAVILFQRLHMPAMIGYIVVGSIVGPYALGSRLATEEIWNQLAEFGIVFLMFSIGLEFSLPHLKSMRRSIFGLGTAELLLVIALTVGITALLPAAYSLDWRAAIVLGAALAMSSTAIVSKLLKERQELNTSYGRKIMAVLLFQDLAVLPLLVFVEVANAPIAEIGYALLFAFSKLLLVVVVLFVLGRKLIDRWLTLVARNTSQELFTLNLLLITLGAAWLSHVAGLSMALGAFMAGILIAETRFHLRVEDEIKPFRDVLLGLFFITIGMSLNWEVILNYALLVALLLGLITALKFVLVSAIVYFSGNKRELGTALRCGFSLAQTGEFSFVLLNAYGGGLLTGGWGEIILAAMVLSMTLTPFLINASSTLVARLSRSEWMQQSIDLTKLAAQTMQLRNHVLLIGYGRCGQSLGQLLKTQNISYQAIDADIDITSRFTNHPLAFGDATRRTVLQAAGASRAKVVVITFNDVNASLRVLANLRTLAPDAAIVVRSIDESPREKLLAAGADEVVADVVESSLMLMSHTLLKLGLPLRKVVHVVQESRRG